VDVLLCQCIENTPKLKSLCPSGEHWFCKRRCTASFLEAEHPPEGERETDSEGSGNSAVPRVIYVRIEFPICGDWQV